MSGDITKIKTDIVKIFKGVLEINLKFKYAKENA